MAVEIIFEAHGTTYDNEEHLSSGHNDVGLSSQKPVISAPIIKESQPSTAGF